MGLHFLLNQTRNLICLEFLMFKRFKNEYFKPKNKDMLINGKILRKEFQYLSSFFMSKLCQFFINYDYRKAEKTN